MNINPTQAIIIDNLKKTFAAKFTDTKNTIISIAPGRVNLIGDHTDYNDGFVFPMTIDRAIYMIMRKRQDNNCYVHALNFQEDTTWQVDKIEKSQNNFWSNYIKGIMSVLCQNNHKINGIEAVVYGDIPVGASLSSSAALEIATIQGLQELFVLDLSPLDAIKLAQAAENNFVGMHCGIMDQYVSRLGKKDHALFIDCRTLDSQNIPLYLKNYSILIVDSKVKRELVHSAYNARRSSCEEAVRECQKIFPEVKALRDVTMTMLQTCQQQSKISQESWQRARHVIGENQRVLTAIEKLQKNSIPEFGALLYESHDSLKNDYATSCAELDCIVDAAKSGDALGARITGAGFGGCAVVLAETTNVATLRSIIHKTYLHNFHIEPVIMPLTNNLEAMVLKL